ncbi:type I restriction endonuclease [Mycoplasma feriruminatoris]|uniref:type I site-specific deoxyribonuclease n=1 Tax=Mycoplasma feriruminatoris TaxID=1179777 RepID=A0AAX3TGW8_9MOLU|nr:type I restriction endonuclease [Mycoplasma feriruminatoris]WFQ92511.1 hypothetical protein MFERI14822_00289 [Mycoplasma feriruminatoris]
MNQFNEKTRVQVPAMVHLLRLGYQYYGKISKTGQNKIYDPTTNILIDVFRQQYKKLNPNLNDKDVKNTLLEINDALRNNDLGRSFYEQYLVSSVKKLIDFENIDNNVFHFTAEFSCINDDEFIPDLTLFINGLPLVFIELKKPNNKNTLIDEQKRMLEKRMPNKKFRRFLNLSQLMIFSNNMEYLSEDGIRPTQGAFYATASNNKIFFNSFREDYINGEEFGFYKQFEYKDIDQQQENKILVDFKCIGLNETSEYKTNIDLLTPTNRIITSLCSKQRLLDILRYGIAFLNQVKEENKNTISIKEKHIIRYPQLFALYALRNKLEQNIKSGTIWHVQGSGKTALSYFLTKFITDYYSKQYIIPKFYFIVDRLDLLEQATREFEMRGLKVNKINSKNDFKEHFKKQSAFENNDGKLEITVVNIQKFDVDDADDNIFKYDLKSQRVFIIDEAHRSYKPEGSFLGKLLSADRNAVKIALTGTPLLKQDKETWKIFGEYIHTYYYDKSIEDGYTLKIFRDDIKTTYKEQLNKIYDDIKIQNKVVNTDDIVEHPNYVEKLVEYIINDFQMFRINNNDNTLGGMIVCKTANQARKIFECFDKVQINLNQITSKAKQTNFNVGLILHNYEDKEFRSDVINDFKYNCTVDLLIVYNMLLTGFDAPRLKKIYLARQMKDHSLLQAITRVNRPYNEYRHGFIVDFADIKDNFEKTNNKYIQELNAFDVDDPSIGIRTNFYEDLSVKKDDIIKEIKEIENKLFYYSIDNLEEFSHEISNENDKNKLLDLKKAITKLQEFSNISILIEDDELKDILSFIEPNKIRSIKNEIDNRIDFINIQDDFLNKPVHTVHVNNILANVIFSFKLVDQSLMDIISEREDVDIKTKCDLLVKRFSEYKKYSDTFEFKDLKTQVLEKIKELRIKPATDEVELKKTIEFFKKISDSLNELERIDNKLEKKYDGDIIFVKIHKLLQKPKKTTNLNIKVVDKLYVDEELTLFELLSHIKKELNTKTQNNKDFLANETVVQRATTTLIKKFIKKNNIENISEELIKYIAKTITKEYIEELNK